MANKTIIFKKRNALRRPVDEKDGDDKQLQAVNAHLIRLFYTKIFSFCACFPFPTGGGILLFIQEEDQSMLSDGYTTLFRDHDTDSPQDSSICVPL